MQLQYMEGEVSGVLSWCPSSCLPTEKSAREEYFFDGHTGFPWTVLGVHIAAALAILSWSIFWSTLLF